MAKKRRYTFDDGDIVSALQSDLGVGQGDNEGNNSNPKETTPAPPQPQAINPPTEAETLNENKGEADSEKITFQETLPQQAANAGPEAETPNENKGDKVISQEAPQPQAVNNGTENEQGFQKQNREPVVSATLEAQEAVNTVASVVTPVTESVENPAQSSKDSGIEQKMEKAAKRFVDTFGRKVKGTNERQHLMITEGNKNRLADIKIAFGIYYQDVINNMIEHFYEQHKELIDYKYEKRRHINR